jgi:hypothetical protein
MFFIPFPDRNWTVSLPASIRSRSRGLMRPIPASALRKAGSKLKTLSVTSRQISDSTRSAFMGVSLVHQSTRSSRSAVFSLSRKIREDPAQSGGMFTRRAKRIRTKAPQVSWPESNAILSVVTVSWRQQGRTRAGSSAGTGSVSLLAGISVCPKFGGGPGKK